MSWLTAVVIFVEIGSETLGWNFVNIFSTFTYGEKGNSRWLKQEQERKEKLRTKHACETGNGANVRAVSRFYLYDSRFAISSRCCSSGQMLDVWSFKTPTMLSTVSGWSSLFDHFDRLLRVGKYSFTKRGLDSTVTRCQVAQQGWSAVWNWEMILFPQGCWKNCQSTVFLILEWGGSTPFFWRSVSNSPILSLSQASTVFFIPSECQRMFFCCRYKKLVLASTIAKSSKGIEECIVFRSGHVSEWTARVTMHVNIRP